MQSVSSPHRFLGINSEGQVSVVTTKGNPYAHVVLRGGGKGPNYDTVHVAQCEKALLDGGVSSNVMIDCSHANSSKDPDVQPLVLKDISHQILEGNKSIIGVMLESNINHGNQSIPKDLSELKYGVSVTDACMGWQTTEQAILGMAGILKDVLPAR
jgi:3-deoxy-7-phosphoheptulonate synthase